MAGSVSNLDDKINKAVKSTLESPSDELSLALYGEDHGTTSSAIETGWSPSYMTVEQLVQLTQQAQTIPYNGAALFKNRYNTTPYEFFRNQTYSKIGYTIFRKFSAYNEGTRLFNELELIGYGIKTPLVLKSFNIQADHDNNSPECIGHTITPDGRDVKLYRMVLYNTDPSSDTKTELYYKKTVTLGHTNFVLHREDGPAVIIKRANQYTISFWFQDNILSNKFGPAYLKSTSSGDIEKPTMMDRVWARDGFIHRENGFAVSLADGFQMRALMGKFSFVNHGMNCYGVTPDHVVFPWGMFKEWYEGNGISYNGLNFGPNGFRTKVDHLLFRSEFLAEHEVKYIG